MAAAPPILRFDPLTPTRMDDLGLVLRGSWGAGCWCLHPRLTEAQARALPGPGSLSERRRAAMARLAARQPAPGLLAYDNGTPVGWIALAPRAELARIEASRATPRVDAIAVWVIPCVTVAKAARGRGIALALIRAAAAYAFAQGAPAIEAYPRAGPERVKDDNAFFGTAALFERAGFAAIATSPATRRNWVPRVTMRLAAPG